VLDQCNVALQLGPESSHLGSYRRDIRFRCDIVVDRVKDLSRDVLGGVATNSAFPESASEGEPIRHFGCLA